MHRGVVKLALTGILLATALVAGNVHSKEYSKDWASTSSTETIPLKSLPKEGQETYQLILQGGPFPFEKDGVVFGNRERLLPIEKRGYYREYTVKTPKVRTRGVRRIICGGPAKTPDACFYTADHYASFRKIVP